MAAATTKEAVVGMDVTDSSTEMLETGKTLDTLELKREESVALKATVSEKFSLLFLKGGVFHGIEQLAEFVESASESERKAMAAAWNESIRGNVDSKKAQLRQFLYEVSALNLTHLKRTDDSFETLTMFESTDATWLYYAEIMTRLLLETGTVENLESVLKGIEQFAVWQVNAETHHIKLLELTWKSTVRKTVVALSADFKKYYAAHRKEVDGNALWKRIIEPKQGSGGIHYLSKHKKEPNIDIFRFLVTELPLAAMKYWDCGARTMVTPMSVALQRAVFKLPRKSKSAKRKLKQKGECVCGKKRMRLTAPVPVSRDGWLRFRAEVAYDGGDYKGWQSQAHGEAVQDFLEYRLSALFSQAFRVVVNGGSRTDAGVHALAQNAHFDLPPIAQLNTLLPPSARKRLPADDKDYAAFVGKVLSSLPPSIRVANVQCVDSRFHSRCDCVGKRYIYRVFVESKDGASQKLSPFASRYMWRVAADNFDVALVNECATRFLIGSRDFSSFAVFDSKQRRQKGSDRKFEDKPNAVKHMHHLHVYADKRRPNYLVFVLIADGFFYRMARCLVGSLVQLGTGKMTPTGETQ